jgi:Tfp pilus assembly protein PilZ
MSRFAPTRRHPRVLLRVPVDVTTIDPETDRRTGRPYFRECRELCGNLSSGGMFIATSDPPRPGRRLLVRIHTGDGAPPIEALARVAWHKPGFAEDTREPGVGVEFVGTSPSTRAAIADLLDAAAGDAEHAPES